MPRLLVALALFGASFLVDPLASAGAPTFEESVSMRSTWGPRISPDGQWIAYTVREVDWDENTYRSQLWLADTRTGEARPLTFGGASAFAAEWDPHGRWLSFARSTGGESQIHLIDPRGGEAWAMTAEQEGVGGFTWSPDGRRIAFTRAEESPTKDREARYFQVDEPGRANNIWLVDVPDRLGGERPKATRLTEGTAVSIGGLAWSPDATQIAFSGTDAPEYDWSTSDIYVVEVADEVRAPRKLFGQPSPDYGPMWSPDGTRLAFITSNASEYFYYTNTDIAVVPLTGGDATILTRAFDEKPSLVAWPRSGALFFSASDRTASHLYRVDPDRLEITRVTQPSDGIYGSYSLTPDGRRLALSGGAPNQVSEILWTALPDFRPRKVTNQAADWAKFTRGNYEVVSWKSRDGETIEGVVIKPSNFDPTRKYPLLVQIHGGPQGIDRPVPYPDRTYPTQQFLQKGAIILRPNYRGSAGYGSKFRALNVRNLGVGDQWDVESGVDHLVSLGWVDPNRVGAMGWSQGGYISAFLATASSRFQAVSVGAGISDWMTYYVNTDIHPFTRQYLRSTPWDDPEVYRKTSPISYVNQAKTPTLIQHGENDRRVPIPNAYQLYQALQDRGVPVEMYVYEGFGHGIGRPKEQLALLEQNYRWFCRWIWGEEDPKLPGRTEEL